MPPHVRWSRRPTPPACRRPAAPSPSPWSVTNPGTVEPLTINSLTDDVYGNLATRPPRARTCGAPIGTVLVAPGASNASPARSPATSPAPPATPRPTSSPSSARPEGNVVTDTDDATVTITGAPSIRVDKTADPTSLPEPGGDFTFTVVVTNTGPETLTITASPTTSTATSPPAPAPPCTTGHRHRAGRQRRHRPLHLPRHLHRQRRRHPDRHRHRRRHEPHRHAPVTDTRRRHRHLTNVVPDDRRGSRPPTPLPLPAPGGTFTFTVVVTNPGTEPVTITTLTDDIYGDLATRPGSTCTPLIGTTLAPGASSAPCSFTGDFTGAGRRQPDRHRHRDRRRRRRHHGRTGDRRRHRLIINIAPDITVDKTATPASLPAPGGTFTFNVVVTNTGPERADHHHPHRRHLRQHRHPGHLHHRHRHRAAQRRHLLAAPSRAPSPASAARRRPTSSP